jgi:hypothetical protein
MSSTFLQDRITAIEAIIPVYEAAITALGAGIQSYTLDTGQTRETVTKLDLAQLKRTLDSLYNTLATLNARCNGGTVMARPAW